MCEVKRPLFWDGEAVRAAKFLVNKDYSVVITIQKIKPGSNKELHKLGIKIHLWSPRGWIRHLICLSRIPAFQIIMHM